MHVEARERGTGSLCGRPCIRTVRAQPTVQYSGHNSAAIKRIPPRLVIQESDGSLPDEPRGVLNAPYIGREARREVNRKNAAARSKQYANVGKKKSHVFDVHSSLKLASY